MANELIEIFKASKSEKDFLAACLVSDEHQYGTEFELTPGILCKERFIGHLPTEHLLLIDGNKSAIGYDVLGYERCYGELDLTVRKPGAANARYFTIYTR